MSNLLRTACAVLTCAAILSCGGESSAPSPSTVADIADAPGAYQACSGPNDTGWCWLQPQVVPRKWQDFQFVDSEHGWGAGESGALIASVDGGRSWHWQLTPLNEELSLVRFSDPDHGWAFAGCTHRVVETQDGGRTWEVVGEIPLGQPLRFFERPVERFWVTSSGTLVAGGELRGSALSEDGGRTWRVLSMRPVTDVGRSGTLWSRDVLEGLWVSRDAGRSVSLALECRSACSIASVDLADDSRLTVITAVFQNDGSIGPFTSYFSSDGGKTWSATPLVVPQSDSTSNFYPIGPLVDGQGWAQSRPPPRATTATINGPSSTTSDAGPPANTLAALWYSSDAGRAWSRATLPPVELDANSLATPLDGTSLWIAAKNKVYVTLDAGLSWRAIQIAGETAAPASLLRSGGVLLAAFGQGGKLRWYSSADGGEAWTALPGGQADATSRLHSGVWFANAQHGLSIGGDGAIEATEDGGRSWAQSSLSRLPIDGLATRWVYPGSHFTPDGVVWVLADERLQRSRDGGRTWEAAAGLPARAAAQVGWIQFVDASHGWLTSNDCEDFTLVPCWATLYRTSDGGLSWQSLGMPEQAANFAFADSNTGVLMRYDGSLYRTEDGGQSWTPLDIDRHSVPTSQLIYFQKAKVGWILPATLSDRRLLKTIDGGRSWTLAATLPETGAGVIDIRFADEDNGWIVGDHGLVLHTSDGGATWQRQDSGTERLLTNLFPIDGDRAWIAAGGGTLLFTRTGGRSP